jgi:hypothetical protein
MMPAGVLAHAEADVARAVVVARDVVRFLRLGIVRGRQVGAAAQQHGQHRDERIDRGAGGGACSQRLVGGETHAVERLLPALRQTPLDHHLQLTRGLGVRLAIAAQQLAPLTLLPLAAALRLAVEVIHLVGNEEIFLRPV